MKNKFIRLVSLSLTCMLALTSFTACNGGKDKGGETTTAQNTTAPAATPLPRADMTWYVVGDPHKDQKIVDEELNKKLLKDINATIKLNFSTWNQHTQKYNLALVSGETVDLIFAATWMDFSKYATMGAFTELNELLPKYAPKTWAEVPKNDWGSATFDGKIYAVPGTNPEYIAHGLFYREDLRKKYGLPQIKDVASLEAYMEGIKKNVPDMAVIEKGISELEYLFYHLSKYEPIAGREKDVVQVKSYSTPRDLVLWPLTTEFEQFCKMTKKWAEKGYWSKDALSSKVDASTAMKAGKVSLAWMTPATAFGIFTNFETEHKDWEGGYFSYTDLKGYTIAMSPMNNGMAIPKSAKYPERALMALDLLRNDADYQRLTSYGIPGNHWELAPDGKNRIVPAKGQDPVENKGFWTTSWGWANYKLMMGDTRDWSGKAPLIESFRKIEKPNIFSDVKINTEAVKTELAAINEVHNQYKSILMLGLAPDVDKTLAEYRDKLKKAGIDKYFEEIKKQTYQYYDSKGIK